MKSKRGIAGIQILLSVVILVFITGLLISIFALMGGSLSETQTESSTVDAFDTTNLVSAWTFEEASGDVVDVWNGNDNGIPFGTPTYQVAGINNYAIDLEDSNPDYFRINDSTDLRGHNITVTAWIKSEATPISWQTVFANDNQDTDGAYHVQIGTSGRARCQIFGTTRYSAITPNNAIPTGVWTYVVGTFNYDERNCKIYVNGTFQAVSGNTTTPPLNATGYKYIGRDGHGNVQAFDGVIDELYIYEDVKSDAWISNEYTSGVFFGDTTTTTTTTLAGEVIDDTTEALADTTGWFSIIITISALIVLILLTIIVVTTIRKGGLVGTA